MTPAANDNAAHTPPVALVPVIGWVGDDGAVTITDPAWRPGLRNARGSRPPFPNDPREA